MRLPRLTLVWAAAVECDGNQILSKKFVLVHDLELLCKCRPDNAGGLRIDYFDMQNKPHTLPSPSELSQIIGELAAGYGRWV
jgi:hypothetical protein